MKNVDGLKAKVQKGELLLGTMDSWLLFKLSGGRVHATDFSNACRTMLFNIHTLQWDRELIEHCGLELSMFPEVKYSDEVFGYTDPDLVFGNPLPISGLLGDSHAGLDISPCGFNGCYADKNDKTGQAHLCHRGK